MASTIDYYLQRRKAILQAITQEEEPSCQNCGRQDQELHVHHVNPDQGHPDVDGGWQHVYLLEQDVKDGVEMKVLCKQCHEETHGGAIFGVVGDIDYEA